MRTKIMKSLLTIACLLGCISVSAYDFTVDGIYYNIMLLDDLTCGVTFGDGGYSGDFVIPEKVTYDSKTFTVVTIIDYAFNGSTMTSVTIPNSVTSIGESAFFFCN